jgi:hypothetical protein
MPFKARENGGAPLGPPFEPPPLPAQRVTCFGLANAKSAFTSFVVQRLLRLTTSNTLRI